MPDRDVVTIMLLGLVDSILLSNLFDFQTLFSFAHVRSFVTNAL